VKSTLKNPTRNRQITAIKTARTPGTQAPTFINKGKFDKPQSNPHTNDRRKAKGLPVEEE